MSLRERLLERTAMLMDIPSESRDEDKILNVLAKQLPIGNHEVVRQDGVLALLPTTGTLGPLVILAGHVDTVPPQGNAIPQRDGDILRGLGACDMKGAISVMWELLEDPPPTAASIAVVLFGREEIPITESALLPFLESHRGLAEASLAIVMEPTNNVVELGCVGNLNATVTFHGEAAHSARPWLGTNAIHEAVRGLARLVEQEDREVHVGGFTYREVVNVTRIESGIAQNVIPSEVRAHVNMRSAPGRPSGAAQRELRDLVGAAATIELISDAPSGVIVEGHPMVDALIARTGEPRPKQGWTSVAEFGMHRIDAVNFGPGDPGLAHRPDEAVTGEELERSLAVLRDGLTEVTA